MPQPNGDGSPGNATIIEQQLELLADIQVIKFTANPASVEPFQNTTVSYQVKLPTALKVPVTFSVNQQTLGHGVEGSASFPVTSSTTFQLHAATNLTGRNIATTQVTMDQFQCKMGSIDGNLMAAAIKTQIDQSLAGTISGTGSTVVLAPGSISIDIPIDLQGQGTMKMDLLLWVGVKDQKVSVTDHGVTVQVHLNTAANVESWCSNAIQTIVTPFMQRITDNEIAPSIQQQLMDQVNGVIKTAEQADTIHRTFALASFALTNDGASFLVCPTTLSHAGTVSQR
jgi:hypothetical protein